MPKNVISHTLDLGLSRDVEDYGDQLADDFYVLLTIGDDEIRFCTLREIFMEQAEFAKHAGTSFELPAEIARFRGVAKHADEAALQIRKLMANWGGGDPMPHPLEFDEPRDLTIWNAQLAAGRQVLAKHGIIVTEKALADAYHAMNVAGDKAVHETWPSPYNEDDNEG